MKSMNMEFLNQLIIETDEMFKTSDNISIEKRKAALNLNCSALAMRIIILKEQISKM